MKSTPLHTKSFVFVDAHLEDLETLSLHFPHEAKICLLKDDENLLTQIATQLKGQTNVAALHLITHGRSGEILLGENGVSLETLPLYGKELLTISSAMSKSGELFLYGCEVASGERGAAFVGMLQDITGLKVAASTHKVGHNELGGSWELDVMSDVMTAQALHVSDWRGVLAATIPLLLDGTLTWRRPNFEDEGTGAAEGDQIGSFTSVSNQVDIGVGFTSYSYAYVKFTVSDAGTYSFKITDTTLSDAVIFLYGSNFAVAGDGTPSGTFIAGDDDSWDTYFDTGYDVDTGGTTTDDDFWPGLKDVSLTPGTYNLVLSSFTEIDTGTVTFEASSSTGTVSITEGTLVVPLINFNYANRGGSYINGFASEASFGNTTDVLGVNIDFAGGVNQGASTEVYEIGGSSGISGYSSATVGALEYLAINSYGKAVSLKQFKVYNDSANDITLTITGHADAGVYDSALATNPAVKTTTAVALHGQWTTITLPADFGGHEGIRIDSGSGEATLPLYFNAFDIEKTPPNLDLNGVNDDGNNFTVTTDGLAPVSIADSEPVVKNLSELVINISADQIKAGDKLTLTSGGESYEISLDGLSAYHELTDGTWTDFYTPAEWDNENACLYVGGDDLALLLSTMKFSGTVSGDRVFTFVDDDNNVLSESTVTVTAPILGISDMVDTSTTPLSFTESELQTAPVSIDTDVTFNWDAAKLQKLNNTTYAKLYINFVDINETAETFAGDGSTYTESLNNNSLGFSSSNENIRFVDDGGGDFQIFYNNLYIASANSNSDGFDIEFDDIDNDATTQAIESIIESLTYTVNDLPTESSKIRIVLHDNTGAVSEPTYIAVNVESQNDAPVLSTSVGLLRANVTEDVYDLAYSVATLPDGSIIVAGESYDDNDGYSVKLVKYAANGTLNTSFGTDGMVTIAIAIGDGFFSPSVAIDSVGKIVVAGIIGTNGNSSVVVKRYNADGSLDTTFTETTFASGNLNQPKIAIAADNSIAISYDLENGDFVVAKITSTGVLDNAFGAAGIKTIDINNNSTDEANDIKISGDNIVVVGTASQSNDTIGLTILNGATGAVIHTTQTGAENGDVWISHDGDMQGEAVAIQSDGKIVVAGTADGDGLILARYDTDGTLDDTFGTDGKAYFDVMDEAGDIAIDSNGKILVLSGDEDMRVVRLDADGESIDTTFGINGIATVTNSAEPSAISMKVASDGTIWIVGGDDADDNTFTIAKISADGIPDADFGSKAIFTTYGDPIVLDGGISLFDGELSNYDYFDNGGGFLGTTLTLERQGGANANDVFSAAQDSYLEFTGGNVIYDGTTVGTFTQVAGKLTINFNNEAAQDYSDSTVNDVMRNIAYSNADETIAQETNISLVWTFNDGNTGEDDGRLNQGSDGAKSATLVQTLNIAIGEPEPISSVTLTPLNPFTTNVTDDTTPVTLDAPEGINITDASNSAISGLPKNVKMPLGQFGFTLEGVENGGTVQMSMTADADFKQFSYFKQNLVTGKWVNIMEGVTLNQDGTATVKFSLTDGGVYDADRIANGVIVDPGGVGENALLPMIAENTTEIGNVSLLDEDAATGTISYAITGGADAAKFAVNASTGLLEFKVDSDNNIDFTPDYEIPTDLGDTEENNTYAVQVTLTGSTSGTEVQNLVVTVLNVAEEGDNPNTAPVIIGLRAEAQEEVIAGTSVALDDIRVLDANGDTMTITLTAVNGTIGGLTDEDEEIEGIQLSGTAAEINTALAGATFTATAAGAASVNLSVTDTAQSGTAITTTSVYNLSASAAATPPSSGGGGGGSFTPLPVIPTIPSVTTTVDGATVQTATVTETRTTTDTSGNTTTTTVSTEQLIIAPVSGTRTDSTGTATTADVPLFWGESSRTEWATTANLPTGVGLTTAGSRAPESTATQQSALDDLLFYIDTTTPSSDLGKAEMLSGGATFLSALANIQTLVVNQITLSTTNTEASQVPITITGVANTVVTTDGAIAPVEALVIDAQSLQAGSMLNLQNVEFAVIIGENLTIRGGDGQNILFTGAGSQNIMLGEDDDQLYAGDGDDIVGSAGGDDSIFGEGGDDTVFGGEGNDMLHGGSDTDVATYSGDMADYIITRDEGKTYVTLVSNPNEFDTIINTETIEFANASYTIENSITLSKIATLYIQVLDRQAEIDGFQYWAYSSVTNNSMGDIAVGFIESQEYKTKNGVDWNTLSTEDKVEEFYLAILNRASDTEGKQHWIDSITSGATFEQVAQGFVDSAELSGIYQSKEDWNFSL